MAFIKTEVLRKLILGEPISDYERDKVIDTLDKIDKKKEAKDGETKAQVAQIKKFLMSHENMGYSCTDILRHFPNLENTQHVIHLLNLIKYAIYEGQDDFPLCSRNTTRRTYYSYGRTDFYIDKYDDYHCFPGYDTEYYKPYERAEG